MGDCRQYHSKKSKKNSHLNIRNTAIVDLV